MTHAAATPAGARIEALDFIRGVALFGILLMNIAAFGLPFAYSDPTNYGGATGVNLWAWIITQVGFEGTQRALFSMLFGAGVVLFMSRLEASGRPDAADIYFRRNLWLVGFGCVNAFILLWFGDILYCYGITALFVFAFRKLAPRALLAIGIASLLAMAAWSVKDATGMIAAHSAWREAATAKAAGASLSKEQTAAIKAWEEQRAKLKPDKDKIDAVIKAKTGGYWEAMKATAPKNTWFQSWFLYRYFFDVFGMMILGMALFRMGVLTLERSTRTYVAMTVIGYAVGLTVNILETRWIIANGFSVIAMAQANISYDLGRLAMTLGHLGVMLLFLRSGGLAWFRHAMAAVGRMALTNYLSHSLICLILFVGLKWFGALERYQLYFVVVAIWAAQLVISPLWLARYRFGPVEWLWRYLTYGARPAMRRDPRGGAEPATA